MNNKLNMPENLPVEKLRPFEGHPYKVQDNEEMENLTESIRQNGILSPLIVRPIENTDEYEVISGHRRLYAAQRAGLETVPAIIYAIDRDTAAILLVDSNLHREHILPSEKAFAYKMKLEAMKQQGKRNDLTSRQVVGKSESADTVTDEESGRQVQRYRRVASSVPYGYRKDPDDREKWLIDESAAEVVRHIFDLLTCGCCSKGCGNLPKYGN